MATRTWSTVLHHNNDTDFRAWAQGILDTLKAADTAGFLAQTADTGQLADPVVAARPAAATAAGYWIFRLDDAHHATFPVYMKLEVGAAAGGFPTTPSMWITVGTGTDGAGVITGTRMARTQFYRTLGTLNLAYEHAASYGDGFFSLAFDVGDLNSAGFYFAVERNRDINGDTLDNVAWFSGRSATSYVWATLSKPPVAAYLMTGGSNGLPILYCLGSTNELGSVGGDVPVFPIEPFFGRRQPPLLGACAVVSTDVGAGVVFTTVAYGDTYTFRRVGGPGDHAMVRGGSSAAPNSAPSLAIRWE